MGLYYNPNPPHIGSQQPDVGRELTPPSGPLVQNPPIVGAVIGQAIFGQWTAAVVTAGIAPIVARNLDPPISAPDRPPVTSSIFGKAIYPCWTAAVNVAAIAPIVARNLDPPISGPVAQNPPITRSIIDHATVLVSWTTAANVAAANAPTVARNLNPPIGVAVRVFPAVPYAIYRAWDPPPPAAIFTRTLRTIDGPVASTLPRFKSLPYAIYRAWQVQPDAPVIKSNVIPFPVQPLFRQQPNAIYQAWDPASPAPITGAKIILFPSTPVVEDAGPPGSGPRRGYGPEPAYGVEPVKRFQPIWDKVRAEKIRARNQELAAREAAPVPLPPADPNFRKPRAAPPPPSLAQYAPRDPMGLERRMRDAKDMTDINEALEVLKAIGLFVA